MDKGKGKRSASLSLKFAKPSSCNSFSRQVEADLLPLSDAHKGRELAEVLSKFQSRLPLISDESAAAAAKKLVEHASKPSGSEDEDGPKVQMCVTLASLLEDARLGASESVRASARGGVERWLSAAAAEESGPRLVAAHLGLLATAYRHELYLGASTHERVREVAADRLKSTDPGVVTAAITLLGQCVRHLPDQAAANKTLSLVAKFSCSHEPRVRHAAFETLLGAHQCGVGARLTATSYKQFCEALSDDFDGVRRAALRLVFAMAKSYPEERIRVGKSGRETLRLVDDAFGKICNAINDLNVKVIDLN